MNTRHRKPVQTTAITSLPPSPDEERRQRMIRYSIAMGVRLVCVITAFLVPGWWALAPAIGAIVLPYVAVVLANVGAEGKGGEVERPGGLEVYRGPDDVPGYGPTASGYGPSNEYGHPGDYGHASGYGPTASDGFGTGHRADERRP